MSSSLTSLGRFGINSTIGILGFIDVASAMGLEAAPMDMSTVLGRAGMDQGPFLMVPAYGPTTAREVHGSVVDDVPFMALPFYVTFAKWALSGIHARAQLVEQEGVVDNSLDPYITTRDMYLMYSEGQVDPNAALQVDEEVLDEAFLDEILLSGYIIKSYIDNDNGSYLESYGFESEIDGITVYAVNKGRPYLITAAFPYLTDE